MKIKVIVMGGYKDSWFKECQAEYQKRIKPYCSLSYLELEPVKLPQNPSEKQIEQALLKEAEMLKSKLKKGECLIALCVEGVELNSNEFSDTLLNAAARGKEITFIIGSSHGLSQRIKEVADIKLSLSKMTLPHQLARIILSEQIYRALTIQKNLKYHK